MMLDLNDLETVRRLAREVVAEKGEDFVYNPGGEEECYYVPFVDPDDDDDESNRPPANHPSRTTGCLVGEIAKRAGVAIELLGTVFSGVNSVGVQEILGLRGFSRANDYLVTLQSRQDGGSSWGEALKHAEGAVSESL